MHINIEALCGQRYTRQLSPLLVALCGCGLCLMLGIYGVLRHSHNCLFFLVARGQT
jgi:hypothetical protein